MRSHVYQDLLGIKETLEVQLKEAQTAQEHSHRMATELQAALDRAKSGVHDGRDALERELKAQIVRLTEDTTRVRAGRDAAQTELAERKAVLSEKFATLAEYKTLIDQSQARIEVLQSEVRRLKAHIAAGAGEEDIFRLLVGNTDVERELFDELRARLA